MHEITHSQSNHQGNDPGNHPVGAAATPAIPTIEVMAQDLPFFQHLAAQQAPTDWWIGCAASLVLAKQRVNLLPSAMSVQRPMVRQARNVRVRFTCAKQVYRMGRVRPHDL